MISKLFSYTAIAMLFVSFQAQAQHSDAGNTPGRTQLNRMLQQQYARLEAKRKAADRTTNGTQERVIAYSGYNLLDTVAAIPAGLCDSGRLFYSGSNGSVFNCQTMDYKRLYYNGTVGNNSSPLDLQNGGESYTGLDVLCDSDEIWTYYQDGAVSRYGLLGKTTFTYSGNNIATDTQRYQNTTGQMQGSSLTYDAAGDMQEFNIFRYNAITASWNTVSLTQSFYDSYGHLMMDSTSQSFGSAPAPLRPMFKHTYVTDAAGNTIYIRYYNYSSGAADPWHLSEAERFTYNADGTISTLSDSVSGGIFVLEDSFGYTPGISYNTYELKNTYDLTSVITRHVSSTGMPDSVYEYYVKPGAGGATTLIPVVTYPLVYDSLNNPTSAAEYDYVVTDTATGAGYYNPLARIYYYYYEPYSTTAVPVNTPPAQTVSIYPNPANDELTSYMPGAVKGSYVSVRLTNMAGQVLRTMSPQWTSDTLSFSVKGMPPGNYIVTIADQNGGILHREKITKL